MPFAVLLTNDVARDLDDLYDYIALNDEATAFYLAEGILKGRYIGSPISTICQDRYGREMR